MGLRRMSRSKLGFTSICLLMALAAKPAVSAQKQPGASQTPAPFYLHAYHLKEVGLDCDACHVSEKAGSVVFQRPGHDQCTPCHQDDFDKNIKQKICVQCHSAFPPTSSDDLLPFPRFKNQRPIVFEFSHAMHLDPHARVDNRTGFRSDCTYCHRFEGNGDFATFGSHEVCAGCHSKAGMKPLLSAKSTTADCRGCHRPEEIENPGAATVHRDLAPFAVSGKYDRIKFSHGAHFKYRDVYHFDCTTCHYAIVASTSLASLALPKMVDCVNCHDQSHEMAKSFISPRPMANCGGCHLDGQSGALREVYSDVVKPPSHTEGFRFHHEAAASMPGAPCFVCHSQVEPSAVGQHQCMSCHQAMLPVSHTARWRDDLHGKYAALDRNTCSECHVTDFCSRCHNETPRSHFPLAQFKAGAHAQLAMLNERSCFTCHTFADTCSECHSKGIR
ncbi:MAG: cytochrome c3 family protein [Terriglobales bacterium]